MSFAKNQLFATTTTSELRTIKSALPVALRSAVMTDRATFIMADEVIVDGEIRTEGYPLTILCRLLKFADGAVIRSDGRRGVPDFPPDLKPETGHLPGADGIDGRDGGTGSPAGNITVLALAVSGKVKISADGGPGGRPENGGDGYPGTDAKPGANITIRNGSGDRNLAIPVAGINGGRAGLPGKRNLGGQGGNIRIASGTAEQPAAGELTANVGAVSPSAQGGEPGKGGRSAPAGEIGYQTCVADPVGGPGGVGHGRMMRLLQGLDMLNEPTDIAEGVKRYFAAQGDRPAHTWSADSRESSHTNLLDSVALAYSAPVLSAMMCETARPSEQGAPAPGGSPGVVLHDELQKRLDAPIRSAGTGDGGGSIDMVPFDWAGFSDGIDTVFLELYVLAVEDEYRCAETIDIELRDKVDFLLGVCQSEHGGDRHRMECLYRCYAMARRISLGLDFYGHTASRVPLLSYTAQERLSEDILDSARNIETTFNAYWLTHEAKGDQTATMTVALEQAVKGESEINNVRVKAIEEARAVLQGIAPLDLKVEAAKILLESAEEALNAAIARENNRTGQCNLINTLVAAASIVAGVSTGGAGFVAAASAGLKLFKDVSSTNGSFGELWDMRKVLGDDLTEIGKGASSVADGIAAIQKATAGTSKEQLPKLPQFVMERKQFDEIAKRYINLEGAEAYREAGYDFLACTEARNQAIVDYNAILVQCIDLQAKAAGAARIKNGIASTIAGQYDPSEPYITSLITRWYIDSLDSAAAMVYAERKSLSYLYGRTTPAPVSALNIAAIDSVQLGIKNDYASYLETFRPKRVLQEGILSLKLSELVSASAWESFKQNAKISFTIRIDNPAYRVSLMSRPGLRITGMQISQTGARARRGEREIPWNLVQGGLEVIYDKDGNATVFSHTATPFTVFTPLDDGPPITKADFSQDDLYAGLSPFATWTLFVRLREELDLDLSELSELEFRLWGYYIEG